MKKKLFCLATILTILAQTYTCAFAKGIYIDNNTKIAIKKYKMGNYTGCLQDCQRILLANPTNAFAFYYMGMAYAQAGQKDNAIKCYSVVLSMNPTQKLSEYAETGKRCLETPDKCKLEAPKTNNVQEVNLSDLDKFIASPPSDGLSDSVKKDFEQKHLDAVKNEINNGEPINNSDGRKLNDSSTPDKTQDKIAQKPTDEQIKAALKVLSDAGINPKSTMTQSYASNQNTDLTQLNALMGGNDQQNNNPNNVMNMLPFMLSQNKTGTANYSPQLMQSFIMNSMMPDFTYNTDEKK
jgi:tetratricopeptide (TPR) repeat protein